MGAYHRHYIYKSTPRITIVVVLFFSDSHPAEEASVQSIMNNYRDIMTGSRAAVVLDKQPNDVQCASLTAFR